MEFTEAMLTMLRPNIREPAADSDLYLKNGELNKKYFHIAAVDK